MEITQGRDHWSENLLTKDISSLKWNETWQHTPENVTSAEVCYGESSPPYRVGADDQPMVVCPMENRHTSTSSSSSIIEKILDRHHRLLHKMDRSETPRQNH